MTLNFEPGTLNSNSSFYHSDGNGNVTMLINPSQYIVAKYLYDAFGNMISKSGLLADANLYRFSSKEAHLNSGLVYYLYRYYDPNLQRWLNRDPVTEGGFQVLVKVRGGNITVERNLYAFVENKAINRRDLRGLTPGGLLPIPAISGFDVQLCPSFGGWDIDLHYCVVFQPGGFPTDLGNWMKCECQATAALGKACLKGDDADWDEVCHSLQKCYDYFW
jgi:RHS repeat-associated protein